MVFEIFLVVRMNQEYENKEENRKKKNRFARKT